MKVRPLGDKILIQRSEAQDKTDSGIQFIFHLDQLARFISTTTMVAASQVTITDTK